MKRFQRVFILLSSLVFLITFSACKTQEDVRREKTVENLNEQVAQTQKSSANASSRFSTLEEEVAKLTGKLEESIHSKQEDSKDTALMKDRLTELEDLNKKQIEFMKALNDKVQEQSKYIEQVIASLSSLTEQKEQSKKKEVKLDNGPLQNVTVRGAIGKYKAHDLIGSKEILLSLVDNKKLRKKEKEAALFYLGMIQYKDKNFEEAKVYFSKLFTEYPESSYGASTLLNLAKTFIQLKSKEEATQSLDELATRYPKSREALEGAKLKTKI